MLHYNRLSFKASETLLGIETTLAGEHYLKLKSFKASETLLGIETSLLPTSQLCDLRRGFKASETLLGIETTRLSPSETQSGA